MCCKFYYPCLITILSITDRIDLINILSEFIYIKSQFFCNCCHYLFPIFLIVVFFIQLRKTCNNHTIPPRVSIHLVELLYKNGVYISHSGNPPFHESKFAKDIRSWYIFFTDTVCNNNILFLFFFFGLFCFSLFVFSFFCFLFVWVFF